MEIVETSIPDVKLITPEKHGDDRGFFCEVYNLASMRSRGLDLHFVQDNHSLSTKQNVVRGLHFQLPPFGQHKLVRVIRGSIFDVAVDLRKSSPTFGRHVSAVVSAEAFNQVLVPIGFAHGFCTLEPHTEVMYKVTDYYAPAHEAGLLWNDPALGIEWPVADEDAILSARDRGLPRLSELARSFD